MSARGAVPFVKAIGFIALSLVLFSGSAFLGVLYMQNSKKARASDPYYNITALVHQCQNGCPLQTSLFAELLDISVDQPVNIYNLDLAAAKEKILQFSPLKDVTVKKILPQTIFISYALRQPVAYVADFANAAIDADAVLIPFNPYYTPKNIPEFYFAFTPDELKSINLSTWGDCLACDKVRLAFSIQNLFQNHFPFALFTLERIDVSNAYSSRWGQRELVVVVRERVERLAAGRSYLLSSRRYLRLTAEQYPQQLANYLVLREILNKELQSLDSKDAYRLASQIVIDMRIDHLALISKLSGKDP